MEGGTLDLEGSHGDFFFSQYSFIMYNKMLHLKQRLSCMCVCVCECARVSQCHHVSFKEHELKGGKMTSFCSLVYEEASTGRNYICTTYL